MIKRSGFIFILLFFISFTFLGFAAENIPERLTAAPDFKLLDLNDKAFSLSEVKDKKGIILFFWTTWCPFCREELKKLNNEYEGLAKNSIQLLTINVQEPKYKVENFVKSRNLKLTVLLDIDNLVAGDYGVFGVPTYVVINKSGQIVSFGNSFPSDAVKELSSK